jgi:hypothetical protein
MDKWLSRHPHKLKIMGSNPIPATMKPLSEYTVAELQAEINSRTTTTKDPHETYEDVRFCKRCDSHTLHNCRDSGHERDSSGDYEECKICRYYRFGMSGKQHEPSPYMD